MTAKRAAQALLELDSNLASFAANLPGGYDFDGSRRDAVLDFIRKNVMNTWTLTLAARASGRTEQQVIAALLNLPPLRHGSTCVTRGYARELFQQ